MGLRAFVTTLILLSVAVQGSLFPSTLNGFSFFLVFDTPILLSGQPVDASRYNLVWGASDAILPMYRSTNPKIGLSFYIPWSRDYDGTHDLAYWQATKPEWVMYKCDKVTPAGLFNDPHIPLDISNPEVIDWQLRTYVNYVDQYNYNGIAADNFAVGNAAGACGIWKDGVWVQKYDGRWEDPNYSVDALHWVATFYDRLKTIAPDVSFGINYSLNEMPPDDEKVVEVIKHTDYVMDEAGFTKWGSGKPTPQKWEEINIWIENIQNTGKHYFGINEFPDQITDADNEWGYASYLMAKGQGSSMVNTIIQGYGMETWDQRYVNLNIGEPVAKRYVEGDLYKRRYSNGFAIVNVYNDAKTFTVAAGFEYKDVFGKKYVPGNTYTINGQSGLVMGATLTPTTTTLSATITTSSTTGSPATTTGGQSTTGGQTTTSSTTGTTDVTDNSEGGDSGTTTTTSTTSGGDDSTTEIPSTSASVSLFSLSFSFYLSSFFALAAWMLI